MKTNTLQSLKGMTIALALLGLMTQFNNCSNYNSATADSGSTTTIATCTTATCITPNAQNLSVTPHLASSGDYGVPASLAEFNLGGDCNEGGYPYNTIRWELMLNGTVVRNSDMLITGSSNANSRCINGRYLIYINLAAITGDSVNRTGLSAGSTRAAYDLWVRIYGQTTSGAALDPSIISSTRVPLTAL